MLVEEVFPLLWEFENEMNNKEKEIIIYKELSLLNNRLNSIDKKIDSIIKKIDKIEMELEEFIKNKKLLKIDEMYFKMNKLEKLEQLNKLQVELDLLKVIRKSVFDYKKSRDEYLKNKINELKIIKENNNNILLL